MDIFFYKDLRVGDVITLSVEDKQIRYKISGIDIAEYQGNKFLHKKKEEIERGNLFSALFENKSDLILQLDTPMQDKPKFISKMFVELTRLD